MKKKLVKKIKEIAKRKNMPESVVQAIFESQFKFTRETIKELELIDEDLSEEEFNKLKTNFNWKHLGKLHTSYRAVQKLKQIRNGKSGHKQEQV